MSFAVQASAVSADSTARRPLFGIMAEMDNPYFRYKGRPIIADAKQRGVDFWQLFIWWSRYEPRPGKYSRQYVRQTKRKIRDLLRAGYKVEVTLTFGDSPPDWVWKIPGAYYKNQYGQEFGPGYPYYENYPIPTLNVVFNAKVREAIARTIKRFFADFRGLKGRLHAVYTNLTGEGDSVLPFVIDDPSNSFWAFDKNALDLQGPGSLAGPYPVPGWYPGKPDDPSPQKARLFYNWYIESAVQTLKWQVDEFRKYYKGRIKLQSDIFWNNENLTENEVERAVATGLGGSEPERFWRLAAGYSTRYAEALAMQPRLVPHHTACEMIEDTQVGFVRRYFSYLSCENLDWWRDYPKPGYDGKRSLDASLERVRRYGIDEFKWVREVELYKYKNPPVEYYARKVREFR